MCIRVLVGFSVSMCVRVSGCMCVIEVCASVYVCASECKSVCVCVGRSVYLCVEVCFCVYVFKSALECKSVCKCLETCVSVYQCLAVCVHVWLCNTPETCQIKAILLSDANVHSQVRLSFSCPALQVVIMGFCPSPF